MLKNSARSAAYLLGFFILSGTSTIKKNRV
jgi:hypothetical protein